MSTAVFLFPSPSFHMQLRSTPSLCAMVMFIGGVIIREVTQVKVREKQLQSTGFTNLPQNVCWLQVSMPNFMVMNMTQSFHKLAKALPVGQLRKVSP